VTFNFESETAIVTGAGSGIGRASAERFAADGANVVVADIDREAAEQTVTQVESAGGTAVAVETDVRDEDAVEAMVDVARGEFGGVDIAHNNAGLEGADDPLADQTVANWDRVVDTNLKGVWLCLKHELQAMTEDGDGGAIVNTSSVAGLAAAGNTPYVASKHGVIGLTRVAAAEYAPDGVRVNAVCPGATETPLLQKAADEAPEEIERLLQSVPLSRLAEPGEIADAVAWLCSEQASFVTGNAYPVDGGFMAL
jgi:NAD(P)-dependent dehydrogenase (short-subunit alcohol dehydrogenase family)